MVALSFYAYQKFIYPIYLKNELQSTILKVSEGKEVVLKKAKNQNNIYSIEIEITGVLKSNTTILVCDSLGIPTQQIRFKKGEIDHFYKGDWYSSICKLKLESKEQLDGELKIDYRFLVID